jgi:hypothetical protein
MGNVGKRVKKVWGRVRKSGFVSLWGCPHFFSIKLNLIIISRTWHWKRVKLGININSEVPEINLKCFLKLSPCQLISEAYWGFLGLFPDLDIRNRWNSVQMHILRSLR